MGNTIVTTESEVPQNIAESDQTFYPPQRNPIDLNTAAVGEEAGTEWNAPPRQREGAMAQRQRPLSHLPTDGR